MGSALAAILGGRAVRWAGATFLGLLLTGGLLGHSSSPQSQAFATGTGETRTVTLGDGSLADLNTRTRLEWFDEADGRRVALYEGEAYFDVKPDVSRPFRIELPQSEIRVLGTRFNVYQKTNGTVRVTVLEGVVAVEGRERPGEPQLWHRELHANQELVFGLEGLIHDTRTSRTATFNAVRWREGGLQFQDEPLCEVIEELQRYTDQHIVVGDPRLVDLRVLGSVSTRDVRVALSRLEKIAPITVIEQDGTFTLNYRETRGENVGKPKSGTPDN